MIKKLLIVIGTRPEAIKLCPLVLALREHREIYKTSVCVTGQHRAMLDQVLDTFEIAPEYDLNVMTHDQTLSDLSARILISIDNVIKISSPDLVIVQGDTTTTIISALAAFYNRVPVGHVEAGLRTNDKYAPFPEEINRKLTSDIADIHFAPTKVNMENLISEGVLPEKIIITGNTVVDALIWVRNKMASVCKIPPQLSHVDVTKRFILVTGHRRENFGSGLQDICYALKEIAMLNPEIQIVYPVHMNPAVGECVQRILSGINNIILTDPLDYETFIFLMDKSYFIISDSGGIQEEAPSIGKPVLVTRDVTERPEAVEAGAVKVVGTDIEKIVTETQSLLHNKYIYSKMAQASNPYGDGKACDRIIEGISRFFSS